ncbi:MAG TPA: hypothetical protein PKW90_07860, partial [Myxococcota bacterium]|nr:hypothetical protein [Myxococcota bacterium]
MYALLMACTAAPGTPPKDSAPIPTPAGPVVLAGGGSEGDNGDPDSWSARLYKSLLEGGDVTGDGKLRVAVLSVEEEDDWLPRYWEELGADEAFNLQVATRADASDPTLEAELADVDAAFLKGGDQGEYYDRWNDSELEAGLLALRERGGGLGGTSAG